MMRRMRMDSGFSHTLATQNETNPAVTNETVKPSSKTFILRLRQADGGVRLDNLMRYLLQVDFREQILDVAFLNGEMEDTLPAVRDKQVYRAVADDTIHVGALEVSERS